MASGPALRSAKGYTESFVEDNDAYEARPRRWCPRHGLGPTATGRPQDCSTRRMDRTGHQTRCSMCITSSSSPHRRRRGEDRTRQEGRRRNPPRAPAGDGFRPRLDPCRKPTQHRRDREGSRQTAAGLAEQGRCRCSRRGRARFSRMEEIHEAALCRSATSRPAGFIAILSTNPGQPCPAFLRIAPADQRSHCAGVPA